MYMPIMAWSIIAMFIVGSSEVFDDVNLLQRSSMQGVALKSAQSRPAKAPAAAPAAAPQTLDTALGFRRWGECSAAEAFCNLTISAISDCQEYWRESNDTCSQAFCNVTAAMQTFEDENKLLTYTYDDALMLRRACTNFARQNLWGPDGVQCPNNDQVVSACSGPFDVDRADFNQSRIDTLKMATFCEELDFMCDGWGLWFIKAAGRQDAASMQQDGDKYSCRRFASENQHVWRTAPGGCDGAVVPDIVDIVDSAAVDDEDGDVQQNTHNWTVISFDRGCALNADPLAFKPQIIREEIIDGDSEDDTQRQAQKLQKCFQRCQLTRGCRAVDIGIRKEDIKCKLFNFACQSPKESNKQSYQLHRSAERELGCGKQGNWEIVTGTAENLDCPSALSAYNDGVEGCMLPQGPLAECVCAHSQDCGGLTRISKGLESALGARKKLVGTNHWDYTSPGTITCKKTAGFTADGFSPTLLEATTELSESASELRTRAGAATTLSGSMDDYLEGSVSRKGCVESCSVR